jgi:hypothetical protein
MRPILKATNVPTLYPKCTPGEMLGLLVLLKDHKGSQEIARLADDLDLEIDEILPSVEFAEGLRLVTVSDGRLTFTEEGRKLVGSTIRGRKLLIREALRRTPLYQTILKALEAAPERRLGEEELGRIVSLTNAPPETILNVITWGRYAELFRYDANEHVVTPLRQRPQRPAPPVSPSRGASSTVIREPPGLSQPPKIAPA